MTEQPTITTVTPKVDAYPCPRVSIVAAPGEDNAALTIWRLAPDTEPVVVRGAWKTSVSGPVHIDDYEAPFGVPLRYSATGYDAEGNASATSTTSDAVMIDDGGCPWVQDPLDPSGAQRWQFAEWPELERQRHATVLYPLLDVEAVAISSQLRAPTCEVVVRTTTPQAATRLLDLVKAAPALLVRSPSAWGKDWTSRYWFASSVTEERRYPYRAFVAERLWTLELTAVAAPTAQMVIPLWVWADVPAYYDTWADVQAAKATWADLYTNVPPEG